MSFLYAVAGSFITGSQAALLNKAKSLPCTSTLIEAAIKRMQEAGAGLDQTNSDVTKRYMIKIAEDQNFVRQCVGMPPLEHVLDKGLKPYPTEAIEALASKMVGFPVKLAKKPVHISEARDFVANEALKVAQTTTKMIKTTVAATTTPAVAESVELSLSLWEGAVMALGLAAAGLSIYAIYKVFCSSKEKTR